MTEASAMAAKRRNGRQRGKENIRVHTQQEGVTSRSTTKIAVVCVVIAVIPLLIWLLLRSDQTNDSAGVAAGDDEQHHPQFTQIGRYELLETISHDPKAFTQGLQISSDQKIFYESTGLYGKSSVRLVDMTGTVLKKIEMESTLFGEGLTFYTDLKGEDRLAVITWKENTGLIYDLDLNQIDRFEYATTNNEGWGITFNIKSNEFYVTDGTHFVHTWDTDWKELRKVPVTMRREDMEQNVEIPRLNELEWDSFSGTLLANVWYQDVILRVDVESGFTTHAYDLSGLYTDRAPSADTLNGIALTDTPNEVWVTGKQWPKMYRIRLLDK